jgi:hypothetical protein
MTMPSSLQDRDGPQVQAQESTLALMVLIQATE